MKRALLWLRFDTVSSDRNTPMFLRRIMSPFLGENGDNRFERSVYTFYLLPWYHTTYLLHGTESFLRS
jgi:hypothetical protein